MTAITAFGGKIFDNLIWVGVFQIFLLIPVCCGVKRAEEQMVLTDECEEILHWFHEPEKAGRMDLKATCSRITIAFANKNRFLERRVVQS